MDDRFIEWRRRIPWNNAQIEIALQEEAVAQPTTFLRDRYLRRAAFVGRTGRITQRIVTLVADRLCKTCALCGKRALYRVGYAGRCQEHRFVGQEAFRARFEERNKAIDGALETIDAERRQNDKRKVRAGPAGAPRRRGRRG